MVNSTQLGRTGRLLDQLIPRHCELCGLPSERDINLCRACEDDLPWLDCACPNCALPMAVADTPCGNCLVRPPAFDRCLAAVLYAQPVSGFVRACKDRGDFACLAILVELIATAVQERLLEAPAPDCVLPMPLHWSRHWRRGFNQATEIARALCRHPDLPGLVLRPRLCRRVRATAPQRGLDARRRRANLAGAFRCRESVHGLHIAIVDDVLTTGQSAHALASCLKAAGAGQVEVWCCARTPAGNRALAQ